MGEYALYKGERIKIGTCETMYYLRFEHREYVKPVSGSLNPSTEKNLFWRLPFPDEDKMEPGSYEPYNRGLPLYRIEGEGQHRRTIYFEDELTDELEPGTIQLTHGCGLLANVPCVHGGNLPILNNSPIKLFWNGRKSHLELAFIKNMPDGTVQPVVKCKFCGHMWRYTWDEIMPYLHGEMKERLSKYATQCAD